ncbi:hypothetical protein FNU76_18735 [Chitinimonas arctica]|uniref:Uncharacterized protein n=1 Tax=Chitinimonas arctica TaxID=2594795 RepID=A0A516SJ84_9NEIS|nr:hypothetical protein [Chitinimonas arctica]QDQ28219.1 hypothetical protein FNU76_18735 [Chitinimonas arctica]
MKQLKKLHQRIADWLRERRIERFRALMAAAYTAGDIVAARRIQSRFLGEIRARSPEQRQRMAAHWAERVAS